MVFKTGHEAKPDDLVAHIADRFPKYWAPDLVIVVDQIPRTSTGKFLKTKLRELYGLRWSVETHFLELKTTLKMRRVKSQSADGVRKELAVYCLVYNLVRAVMVRAARRQDTTPDRISFIDALRWLRSGWLWRCILH